MKRIAVFIGTTDYTGGPQMGLAFALFLKASGWQVIVVCGLEPSDGTPSIIKDLKHADIPIIQNNRFSKPWSFSLVNQLSNALKDKIDIIASIIQIDFKIASLVANKLKVPCVYTAQSMAKFYGPGPVKFFKRITFGLLLKFFTAHSIATSPTVKFDLISLGMDHKNITIIPSGINVSKFITQSLQSKDILRRSLRISEPGLLVLNVGRLDLQKGQHLILEFLSREFCEEFNLHFAFLGDNTLGNPDSLAYKNSLIESCQRKNLQGFVHFLGWQSNVFSWLKAADLYLHAALWEGPPLPLAVIEAMAAELPVIFTDCAGIPDGFIQDQHGWIVPANSSKHLEFACRNFLSQTESLRRATGINARFYIQSNYDLHNILTQYQKVIEDTLHNK